MNYVLTDYDLPPAKQHRTVHEDDPVAANMLAVMSPLERGYFERGLSVRVGARFVRLESGEEKRSRKRSAG